MHAPHPGARGPVSSAHTGAARTHPQALLHVCIPSSENILPLPMCSLQADVDWEQKAFYSVPGQNPGDSSPETL